MIAVAVMGRRAEPLVVPLAGAAEKTVEDDGVRLTVHEAVVKPKQFMGQVELTFEIERLAETLRIQGLGIGPLKVPGPLDLLEREIEVVDSEGRSLDWSFMRRPTEGVRGRMRLRVLPSARVSSSNSPDSGCAPSPWWGRRSRSRSHSPMSPCPDRVGGGPSTCSGSAGSARSAPCSPPSTNPRRRSGSGGSVPTDSPSGSRRRGPSRSPARRRVPALRAAGVSENPRIRARVASSREALERRAETDRVTHPTFVRLDFNDRRLSEVIDALNGRQGFSLAVQLGPLPSRTMIGLPPVAKAREDEVQARRVTVEADRELPFWEAVDRLVAAGHLTPELDPQSPFGLSNAPFRLFDDPGGPSVRSDVGPFRVRVTGLHATFEQDVVGAMSPAAGTPRAAARKRDGGELLVRMAVILEPGRVVRQFGRRRSPRPWTIAGGTCSQPPRATTRPTPTPGPQPLERVPFLRLAGGARPGRPFHNGGSVRRSRSSRWPMRPTLSSSP